MKIGIAVCTLLCVLGTRANAGPAQLGHFPPRPIEAANVKVMIGRVIGYTLTKAPLAEHLTVKDIRTDKTITLELSANTFIDGTRFTCVAATGCSKLPGTIVLNRTVAAILYWDTNPSLIGAAIPAIPGSGRYATDLIETVP